MAPSLAAAAPAALLCLLALAGCTSTPADDGDGDGSGTGSASVYVKDAPADEFREVHVVFTKVEVHRSSSGANGSTNGTNGTSGNGTSNGTADANGTADDNSTAGWVTLFQDASGVHVDLLNTTGAKAAFLGEEDLAAGHYQQVRITVKEAFGIRDDGSRVNFTVSSGTLRSVKSFEVEDGKETRITVDIDLDRSLRQQGNGEWRMTPVIGKTTAQVVEDSTSGEDAAQPGEIESVPEAA